MRDRVHLHLLLGSILISLLVLHLHESGDDHDSILTKPDSKIKLSFSISKLDESLKMSHESVV